LYLTFDASGCYGLGLIQSGLSQAPCGSDDRATRRLSLLYLPGRLSPFTILGSVPEGIPAIVSFCPRPVVVFPIARAVGVHEVHYAMVIILAMGIGLFAPLFVVGYYAARAIGRVDPAEGTRPIRGICWR
jgi:tripartite ATP-independent transporter DctM subunit